jgi:hypothetical protein
MHTARGTWCSILLAHASLNVSVLFAMQLLITRHDVSLQHPIKHEHASLNNANLRNDNSKRTRDNVFSVVLLYTSLKWHVKY